jgi:hypothetical protein
MLLVLAGLGITLAGCASDAGFYERVTRENGAHFATWNHLDYSVRRATPEETRREDILAAGTEKWFGRGVQVEPIH